MTFFCNFLFLFWKEVPFLGSALDETGMRLVKNLTIFVFLKFVKVLTILCSVLYGREGWAEILVKVFTKLSY